MKRMRARRSFWHTRDASGSRRIVRRGETFSTTEQHAIELQKRGIATPASDLGPTYTQVTKPAEQPAIGQAETPSVPPQEVKTETAPEQTAPPAPAEPAPTSEQTPDPAPITHDAAAGTQPLNIDLEGQSIDELRARGKLAKIKGYNNMGRDKLITKLREANNNGSTKN